MKITQWNKADFSPKEVKINVLIDDEHSKEIQNSLGGLEDSVIRLSLNKLDKVQRVNAVLKKP
ncbi:hypothetical protein [Campylobacter coli]|uniref:hypothetical protein n=1 Tax=Campylobacter coli TaxID=195 RepID=UPI0005CA7476|nr:hypothetical protein [Campylobacter coli]